MRIRAAKRWTGVLATVLLAASACGGGSKGAEAPGVQGDMKSDGQPEALRVPSIDPELCAADGKNVVTSDLNHDGKADVWKLYQTIDEDGTKVEVLTCKQVDFDNDGKKDYVAIYAKTGDKIAEEFDFGFDGTFDAREHYAKKGDELTVVERDSDHDQKPDIWEKYKDGKLDTVHRDRNGDGKPDMWEQYENGELVTILYDDDFDSRVDRKETSKKAPAPTATPPSAGGPADEGAADATTPPPADAGK
jgi:hypothetical protein